MCAKRPPSSLFSLMSGATKSTSLHLKRPDRKCQARFMWCSRSPLESSDRVHAQKGHYYCLGMVTILFCLISTRGCIYRLPSAWRRGVKDCERMFHSIYSRQPAPTNRDRITLKNQRASQAWSSLPYASHPAWEYKWYQARWGHWAQKNSDYIPCCCVSRHNVRWAMEALINYAGVLSSEYKVRFVGKWMKDIL